MRRYREKPVYKVQYVIAENDTNKVLRVITHEVDRTRISDIRKKALELNHEFCNTYVLIKVY